METRLPAQPTGVHRAHSKEGTMESNKSLVCQRDSTEGVRRSTKVTGRQYHCRGCGKQLTLGWRALFHPDCLNADKRHRIREKRRREREKIWKWLRKDGCAGCQANFRSQERISWGPSEQSLCEASQGPQSHENSSGQGLPLENSASEKVSTSEARLE